MSLLKKISEAKFHETADVGKNLPEKISEAVVSEMLTEKISSGENFPCGHSVAEFAWICSATRRARCAACDPRTAGVGMGSTSGAGSAQRSPILAESATLAESADAESDEINPGERRGSAFAFFDIETPSGAWSVATRFPGLWGRSGGTRQKPAPNITAGTMLGWAAEREGPSLGRARFASIREWQRSLGVELDENGRAVIPDSILATRRRVE